MEAIPILTLFLLMPLDAAPAYPPVRRSDLSMFPAEVVVRRERKAAWDRYLYTRGRSEYAQAVCADDRDYWQAKRNAAYFAWDLWDDCLRAQRPEEFCNDCVLYRLDRIRRLMTPPLYYAGQLPGPVDVSGAPESVPLP